MSNGKHRCRHRRRRHRSVQMEAHKCLMYIVGCRIQSPNIYSGLSAVQTCETNKSDCFVLMTTRSSSLKHTYLYTRLSEMSWLRGPEFACRWFTFVTFSLQELGFTGNVCVRVQLCIVSKFHKLFWKCLTHIFRIRNARTWHLIQPVSDVSVSSPSIWFRFTERTQSTPIASIRDDCLSRRSKIRKYWTRANKRAVQWAPLPHFKWTILYLN